MIMVLVVKGKYLQKTAEWVCSCWTVRSRAGETQKLFLTQALDAARGSERINCCNEDLTIELVVMVVVWHLAVAAKSVAEKRKESQSTTQRLLMVSRRRRSNQNSKTKQEKNTVRDIYLKNHCGEHVVVQDQWFKLKQQDQDCYRHCCYSVYLITRKWTVRIYQK